jgi:hypothetical protein
MPRAASDAERILRPFAQACRVREAAEFYREVEGDLGIEGQRALGRVDRFYLLTRLCKRVDAAHPWLYAAAARWRPTPMAAWTCGPASTTSRRSSRSQGRSRRSCSIPTSRSGSSATPRRSRRSSWRRSRASSRPTAELKLLYPDVLYDRPDRDSPLWSVEKGIVVRAGRTRRKPRSRRTAWWMASRSARTTRCWSTTTWWSLPR